MITVALILVVAAIIATIASMMGKCPLYVPVLLLCFVAAIGVLPIK